MSIGRDEVLHVARLAELAVKEADLDRLVDQLNRIVDYVAQLDRVPADGAAEVVPARPGAGRAARGRARLGAARPAAGRAGARVRRRLLPRAAARRDGGPVSAAAVAADDRRAPGRGRRGDGLNATLHWSQALLDAEARAGGRVAGPGPLRAHADRAQGQHRHHRRADHLRLAHPRGLRLALRRDRGQPAPGGRRDDRRQDQHGRVRHGLVHRALGLRPGAASARPEPRARRIVGRLGGAGGRRRRARRARLGDRRLGAPAGELLRGRRREAELRPGEPVRPGGVRLVARLHLGVRPHRGRRGAGARRDERARSARQHHAGPAADGARPRRCRDLAGMRDRPARASTSRPISTRASPRRWSAPRPPFASSAPSWWTCRCRNSAYAVPTYYIVAPAEAAANLARYDGVRYGPRKVGPGGDIRALYQATRGRGVRRRGAAPHPGRHLRAERRATTTPTIGKAQRVRALHRRRLPAGLRGGVDLLLTPTTPTRRSGPARRPKTRSRCTWPTSSSAPSAWPACRR